MTEFAAFRDKIRRYIVGHERDVVRVWNFVVALCGLLIVNDKFGYMISLRHWWLAVIIAIACAFLPMKGLTAVVMVYGFIHLMSLSTGVALTAFAGVLIMLAACGYFRGKNTYNLMTISVCYQLSVPFAIPLGAGLLRNINELVTIVAGGILSYYLKVVSENASLFLDSSTQITALDLIRSKMLNDQMFYFYMVAMVVMFLMVYSLRNRDMDYAWLKASIAGVAAEFVIMTTGYLVTGNATRIPTLIISNIVLLVVGYVFTFFILDLDYTRVERVQFEDDEYYYYVTAVPKVKVAQDDIEVKKITEQTQNSANIRRSFRRKERK